MSNDDASVLREKFETTESGVGPGAVGQVCIYSGRSELESGDLARFRMRLTGGGFAADRLRVDRLEYNSRVGARVEPSGAGAGLRAG